MALPALVGAGGLAMDTVHWTLMQRQMQREADSAALAGAYAKAQGSDATAAANASLARDSLLTLTEAPVINPNAPYAGSNSAVKVTLTTKSTLPFSSLFLSGGATVLVEATAASLTNGEYCVISLEKNNQNRAIYVQGSSNVTLGCGLITNSKGAAAVDASGNGYLAASHVGAVGGIKTGATNISEGTALIPYTVAQSDPFADVPSPTSSDLSPCQPTLSVPVNGSVPQQAYPGCYKGMDIQGKVHFNPGIYYIDGYVSGNGNKSNSLSIGAQAEVTGTGVTFILTSSQIETKPSSVATISMDGKATVNLEATSDPSSPYKNLLFYQDRRATLPNNATSSNLINGNSSSNLTGAVYFPSQTITFNGDGGITYNCVQLVSRRVIFSGNATVTNVCDEKYDKSAFLGTRVYLVG